MKAITTTDHNYYEVTLVVAVPNYGDNASTALDYIAGMDSAVIVLEATEKRLSLHTTVAAAVVTNVVNNTTTSTNVVAPKKAKRKTKKEVNANKPWLVEHILLAVELSENGKTNKQIGKQLCRSEKAVALAIWKFKKG